MCLSADKLFALEDRFIKQPGLYALWTILYVVNLLCLASDSSTGPVRDFNIMSWILSTVYCTVSTANNIYGNKLPSSMLLIAGPIHQYSGWLLLAYYRGAVYGSTSLGVLNAVYTFVLAVFTADMVLKSWTVAIKPQYYLDYVKSKTPSSNGIENV